MISYTILVEVATSDASDAWLVSVRFSTECVQSTWHETHALIIKRIP